MNGIILKIIGVFFCLFSGVLALTFLSFLGIGLSFMSFITGFFLIVYAFEKNRKPV
jgi:hypothetical protein